MQKKFKIKSREQSIRLLAKKVELKYKHPKPKEDSKPHSRPPRRLMKEGPETTILIGLNEIYGIVV